eukprot:196028-Pyramimonas_sp.AAC.1
MSVGVPEVSTDVKRFHLPPASRRARVSASARGMATSRPPLTCSTHLRASSPPRSSTASEPRLAEAIHSCRSLKSASGAMSRCAPM